MCLWACPYGQAYAQFTVLETEQLRLVYYGSAQAFVAKHTARCFQNSLAFHTPLFDYHSREKITLALYDPSDFGNAGAGALPWNAITMAIAPPSYAFETNPSNERINATMNHEIVHIVASDKTTGRDRFFRALFHGKIAETSEHPETILYSYLTIPRRSAPRWYHEGIAVFLETWMAGGLGRALGSYDEMVFRTAIRDSSRLYDLVGLESEGTKINFQVGAMSYLYGGRFMSYMAWRDDPQKLISWVSRTEGSHSYFSSQFKNVYGISLDSAWTEWLGWEQKFQESNLSTLRQYPITSVRPVTAAPLGSVSKPQLDIARNLVYLAISYPGQVGHIAAIHLDNGRVEKVCDIKGSALYFVSSIAYDSASGTMFYTTDNNSWRDLKSVDVHTGDQKTLMRDDRVGDLVYSQADSALWGIRHFNGVTTVVRIPPPYTQWNQIYSWPFGRDMYGIDISPDGKFLTAGLSEIDGSQRLIRISLDSLRHGDTTYAVLYDFHNSIPANFVHSRDGRYLYGTSYVSGVSNVFRYDLVEQKMEALTNVETGVFNPVPLENDSLLMFAYSDKGFQPEITAIRPIEDIAAITFLGNEITKVHPVVTTWLAGSPGKINIDSLTTYSGPYRSFGQVRVAALYPIIEGYQEAVAYGLHTDLRDPLNQHRIDLTLSYSPDRRYDSSEQWHGSFGYAHGPWQFNGKFNDADFYDLFGPTKSSRKGYSVGAVYSGSFINDEPRTCKYRLSLTRYGDLERLPEYQNITTSFDRFWSFGGNLSYANQRSSLGAVDQEKGINWKLSSDNKYVNDKWFTRVWAEYALGMALPLNHSSIWLRNSAGYSPNHRDEPLANFFFGGFGNNWVDNQAEKRYREYYSFPGAELNALGGSRYAKSLIEWTLPPVRFRHVGGPYLYATWARPALFVSALITNPDDPATRQRAYNLGGQIDIRMVALSHLNMTLSFGYAVATEVRRRPTNEFMASLKVL
jgi:hypothetical protein